MARKLKQHLESCECMCAKDECTNVQENTRVRVFESRHCTLEQLQFSEKTVLLFDLLRRLAPFCLSAQLADLTCLEATHIIGSWSGHTPSVGESQKLQGPRKLVAGLTRTQSSTVAVCNVLPKKLTVQDCDDSGPR